MRQLFKRVFSRMLVAVLRPCAGLREGGRRMWAFSCLAAQLRTPLDSSVVVLGAPDVPGTANIKLGRELMLSPGLHLETQENGRIVIGDRAVISRGTHIVSFSSVTIGDDAMIGEYVSIRDANHKYGSEMVRCAGHDSSPITIGRNVWIGRGAAVLAGVTIGDNAVVGANAVVTHNVAANQVVAGVPARPIAREATA
jgi:acetyltransferase-like isoleucine patch superfamily enzyme